MVGHVADPFEYFQRAGRKRFVKVLGLRGGRDNGILRSRNEADRNFNLAVVSAQCASSGGHPLDERSSSMLPSLRVSETGPDAY